jgi:RNA polymerase sigma-70 factor (ECF subfamily)
METPDFILIARVLADDDRQAFAELVRRHEVMLCGFLTRLTNDSFLADDLAQETFVEAYRNLGKFSGKSTFSTWLLGVGYNLFRQYKRRKPTPETATDMPDTEDEEADSASRGTEVDVQAAIAKLGEDQRAAIELCFVQGLSHEEAANVLHCPLGTLKTNILRAKEKLKTHLAAYALHS